jgi:hypothetical protein
MDASYDNSSFEDVFKQWYFTPDNSPADIALPLSDLRERQALPGVPPDPALHDNLGTPADRAKAGLPQTTVLAVQENRAFLPMVFSGKKRAGGVRGVGRCTCDRKRSFHQPPGNPGISCQHLKV